MEPETDLMKMCVWCQWMNSDNAINKCLGLLTLRAYMLYVCFFNLSVCICILMLAYFFYY